MSIPILNSKLLPPPLRENYVSRVELLEVLDGALHPAVRLILLSAPAGYGKSTLLSAWIHQRLAPGGHPAAWLSLEEGENDPVRFFNYLGAALETLPGVPAEQEFPYQVRDEDECLSSYINLLEGLTGPAVLVLDDLHLLENPEIHRWLAFFLEHISSLFTLVIATRADPPLPLAALRAEGALVEIRQDRLAFNAAEAASFLNQGMSLTLQEDQINLLTHRTEGWIAGLQMAALSLQGEQSPELSLETFSGSHRYVMDYLLEEVLRKQSPQVQDFLLKTSILPRLNGPLCHALIDGLSGLEGQSTLAALEKANLFIYPLDQQRVWYRYHRLFSDLLRRQLARRDKEQVKELNRRASRWFEDQLLWPESITHAFQAGEHERAANLIEQVSEHYLMRSEVVTLRQWLEELPEEILQTRGALCAAQGWMDLLAGESIVWIASRFKSLPQEEQDSGPVLALQGIIAMYQGQLDRALALLKRTSNYYQEVVGFWAQFAAWLLKIIQISENGDDEQISLSLQQEARVHFQQDNILLGVIGLSNIGELRIKQGRLDEAEKLLTNALEVAVCRQGKQLPIAGLPMLWIGEIARLRNQLETAEEALRRGIEMLGSWGRIPAIEGYCFLAQVQQAQGDFSGADKTLDQAARLAEMFDATSMDDHLVALVRARLAALEGNYLEVDRWMQARKLEEINPEKLEIDASIELHLRKYELTTLGLIFILMGKPERALRYLEPLLEAVGQIGRWNLGIEILIQQAAALDLLQQPERALSALAEAMRRAKPEGYLRPFLDLGGKISSLLYRAVAGEIHAEYAGWILSNIPAASDPDEQRSQGVVEKLSEREIEILAEIAEGYTNQEIARSLSITEGTVKWHASNIYGKLQVGNRTEAVARARLLGLLSS